MPLLDPRVTLPPATQFPQQPLMDPQSLAMIQRRMLGGVPQGLLDTSNAPAGLLGPATVRPGAAAGLIARIADQFPPLKKGLLGDLGGPTEGARAYQGGASAPDAELVGKAVAHFGKTRNPSEAGYILQDGSMLDLSGRHYMQNDYVRQGDFWVTKKPGMRDYQSGRRDVDHREVGDIVSSGGWEGMKEFMSRSQAARYNPRTGAEVSYPPSEAQAKAIIRAHKQTADRGDPLMLDYSNPQTGEVVASKEFASPNLDAIMSWFRSFK